MGAAYKRGETVTPCTNCIGAKRGCKAGSNPQGPYQRCQVKKVACHGRVGAPSSTSGASQIRSTEAASKQAPQTGSNAQTETTPARDKTPQKVDPQPELATRGPGYFWDPMRDGWVPRKTY